MKSKILLIILIIFFFSISFILFVEATLVDPDAVYQLTGMDGTENDATLTDKTTCATDDDESTACVNIFEKGGNNNDGALKATRNVDPSTLSTLSVRFVVSGGTDTSGAVIIYAYSTSNSLDTSDSVSVSISGTGTYTPDISSLIDNFGESGQYSFRMISGSGGSKINIQISELGLDETITETTPPQWSNPDVNVTNPSRGESVNISVVWEDTGSGSDFSWLETNETGSWRNYTDGTYGSPRDLGDTTSPITVNFSWTNQTGKPRVIGWVIYANDTGGYENGTNNPSGAYEGNFTMWGWSNITWTSPDDGSANVGDMVKLVCFVNDTNTTGSGPVEDYDVTFYNETDSASSLLGTNYTNSSGYAVYYWDTTGLSAGTYYPKCNITDNSTLYYNASEYNQANTTISVENFVAINISSALQRGILFGSLTVNTDDNMAENDTTSSTNTNCTEYWIGSDPSTTGTIHLWHYAADMTKGGVTTDKILIGNVTNHANKTANGVNVNMTEWKVSTSVPLTTSWAKIGGASTAPCDDLAIGAVCYVAYWLDVPSNIPSGTYNTTYNYCGNLTSTSVSCDG